MTLAEQLLLLALDDETGKLLPLPDRALDYALAGAILADLARVGRISVDHDTLTVIDPHPVQSVSEDLGLLDLNQAAASTLKGALAHLASDAHGLRQRLTDQLVAKGVLREEDHEFLWVFHYSRYPLSDPGAESAIKQRLRNRIRSGDVPLSDSDHVLIALIHACQLDDLILSEEEQERWRDRVVDIVSSDRIGQAVNDCIAEIQKAILEIRTYSGM